MPRRGLATVFMWRGVTDDPSTWTREHEGRQGWLELLFTGVAPEGPLEGHWAQGPMKLARWPAVHDLVGHMEHSLGFFSKTNKIRHWKVFEQQCDMLKSVKKGLEQSKSRSQAPS